MSLWDERYFERQLSVLGINSCRKITNSDVNSSNTFFPHQLDIAYRITRTWSRSCQEYSYDGLP
jgi:hypothetical protein